MAVALLTLLSLTLLASKVGAWRAPSPPKYVELYFTQQVDHFNYEVPDTFLERYLLSGEYSKLVHASVCRYL